MTENRSVVIVGGGTAAASVAANLRRAGFAGAVTILSAETQAPYERPPLSKQVITGDREPAALRVLPEDWYTENEVELRLGVRARRLDPGARTVEVGGSAPVAYTSLVLATGGSPRTLAVPGVPPERVRYLRSVPDAMALRERLASGRHLVIVGAGFIGGELAASARAVGAEVTMLELLPVPLGRVVGDDVGRRYTELHRAHGVAVRTGVSVESGRVSGDGLVLTLTDGTALECDDLVVGIGIVPHDELARDAGIACDGGIFVDPFCATSAPDVWAAGDVARHEHPLFETALRVEHHDNALRQGAAVAANIVGSPVAFADPHWFWSDQYDHRLQGVGLVGRPGLRTVDRGSLDDLRFTRFYLDGHRLVGALSMNTGTQIKHVAKLLTARAVVAPDALADPDVDLKKLVRSTAVAL